MLRISNIRIGTKLGIISGLGILLVLAMEVISIRGGGLIKQANDIAIEQQILAREIVDAKASLRGLQIAVRDVRLADSSAKLQAAVKYLESRQASVGNYLVPNLPKFRNPENRARAEKIQAQTDQYVALVKEMATLKQRAIDLRSKSRAGSDSDSVAGQIATLDREMDQINDERIQPMNAEMAGLADKTVDALKEVAAKETVHAEEEMAAAQQMGLAITIGVVLIMIGSAVFGVLGIARPLARLVPELKKIADGDFNVDVPGLGRKDEIGQIAEAAEMVAERVGSTIVNIKLSASEVTNASAEISTSTTDLSQRTEEQAASLEETSASMEEMTATVKKNAENARQASELATSTREVADRGGEVVARTVEAMAKIEDSSRKISDIIIVIDEIARQTNLLALNAAVEAARAGDAGRGFAVVASEVRSLAQRSSQAAKDIKDLITNSTGQVKDGVELVNRAGQSLTEIVNSIKKVTAVVTEIANASMEQSTGIEQINRALTQMDEVTQQNSALVEENAATAKTLEQQAKSMDERVAAFKVRGERQQEAPAAYVGAEPAGTAITVPRRDSAPQKRPAAQPKHANGAAKMNGTHGGPVGRMQGNLAVALKEDPDWKEF